MNKIQNFLMVALILVMSSCGGGSSESGSTSSLDEKAKKIASQSNEGSNDVKLQQYMVSGKEIYKTYCVACHQMEGQGLAQLYPPLAKSDYLMADLARAACGVRNGQFEPITVNGVQYNQIMPGIPSLTDLEVAQVITYVSNSWGNEAGISEVKEVSKWLADCKK